MSPGPGPTGTRRDTLVACDLPQQHSTLALGPESQDWRLRVPHSRDPHPPCPALLQVEGRWLTVQLASSHAHLVSPDDPLRLALHSIRSRDGDLELILFWT